MSHGDHHCAMFLIYSHVAESSSTVVLYVRVGRMDNVHKDWNGSSPNQLIPVYLCI